MSTDPNPGLLPRPRREEALSSYSHLLGALAALAGTGLLAWGSAGDGVRLAISLVYGLSMTFMFSASYLYHGFKTEEAGQGFWRRLDHVAIFFMIAGSYTPICALHLDGGWRLGVLGVQWCLVLAGALFKLLFIGAPRALAAGIYLVMGWMVVIPLGQLLASVPALDLWLIAAGGAAYSAGGVIYAIKRPDPLPGLLGFHEIFHLLVLLGAGIHYLAMYRIILGPLVVLGAEITPP